ncbi:unnamed protein product, partial [Phaeothamnion confervicola]
DGGADGGGRGCGSSNAFLRPGDSVEAKYPGNGRWYTGRVAAEHSHGTMDIAYDDLRKEYGVALDRVRPPNGSKYAGSGGSGAALGVGDAIEAKFKDKGRWFKGKVKALHRDGTIDICYDDGDTEECVAPANVRPLGSSLGKRDDDSKRAIGGTAQAVTTGNTVSAGSTDGGGGHGGLTVGDAVEANYKAKGRWFKGKVRAVHRDS